MGERRQFSPPFKAERVLELLSSAQTPAGVCRRVHGIKPSLLLAWRKRLLEQAPKVFEREGDRDPAQARIADLERLVGRLPLELEVEKKPPLVMSSGCFDSLPHNGAVTTLLGICRLTHRQSYFDIFIVTVAIPLSALVVVISPFKVFQHIVK